MLNSKIMLDDAEFDLLHLRQRQISHFSHDFKLHNLRITLHAMERIEERHIPIDRIHRFNGRHGEGRPVFFAGILEEGQGGF